MNESPQPLLASNQNPATVVSGEPPKLSFLRSLRLLLTDPGALNKGATGPGGLATAWKLYGLGAGIGFGVAEIFDQRDLGALYVFAGGVYGRVAAIGEWLAFMTLVPVLAASLTLMHRKSQLRWRDHLVFSLHVGAFVGLAVAVEFLLVVSLGVSRLGEPASWVMLVVFGVYYFLSIIDTYGRDYWSVVKGGWAVCAVIAVWIVTAFTLATFIDFRF